MLCPMPSTGTYRTRAFRRRIPSATAGRPATLDVIRRTTGEQLTAAVTPLPVTVGHVVDLEFTETVVGLVFWLLAVLVLRARSRHITNQVFAIVTACIAIHHRLQRKRTGPAGSAPARWSGGGASG